MVLENLFDCSIIGTISLKEDEIQEDSFAFLKEFIRSNVDRKICLLSTPEINNDVLINIKDFISNTSDLPSLKNFEFI